MSGQRARLLRGFLAALAGVLLATPVMHRACWPSYLMRPDVLALEAVALVSFALLSWSLLGDNEPDRLRGIAGAGTLTSLLVNFTFYAGFAAVIPLGVAISQLPRSPRRRYVGVALLAATIILAAAAPFLASRGMEAAQFICPK